MIRLFISTEQHFDVDWGCERTYYYLHDANGRRYSEIEILPSLVWSNVTLAPLDNYGMALDDEMRLL